MSESLTRAVWALGAAQCVLWGLLYYSFSVLIVPMQAALGLTRPQLAGAFSLALLVSAVAAPAVGRLVDRGHGPAAMRFGSGLAVVGLLLLSQVTAAWTLYLAWVCLGLAMALVLYEPAFALLLRAIADPHLRLRAVSAVTVAGGLASTVFVPLLAGLEASVGWRFAVLASAVGVVAIIPLLERQVFPHVLSAPGLSASRRVSGSRAAMPAGYVLLALLTVTGTLAGMALIVLLMPMLIDRGVPAPVAALALAAFGISQLPGRLWLLRAPRMPATRTLLAVPLVLQGLGLLMLALAHGLGLAATGVALFGCGAGLFTVVRPLLVGQCFGVERAGALNGRLARWQGFARALGPLLATLAAVPAGATPVLLVLAALSATLLGLTLATRFDDA